MFVFRLSSLSSDRLLVCDHPAQPVTPFRRATPSREGRRPRPLGGLARPAQEQQVPLTGCLSASPLRNPLEILLRPQLGRPETCRQWAHETKGATVGAARAGSVGATGQGGGPTPPGRSLAIGPPGGWLQACCEEGKDAGAHHWRAVLCPPAWKKPSQDGDLEYGFGGSTLCQRGPDQLGVASLVPAPWALSTLPCPGLPLPSTGLQWTRARVSVGSSASSLVCPGGELSPPLPTLCFTVLRDASQLAFPVSRVTTSSLHSVLLECS